MLYVFMFELELLLVQTLILPAYIIGEGKMARTVESASRKLPSSSTALCCSMRTLSGASSSLVQPPRGCSKSTGFLKPFSRRMRRVSFMSSACPLCIGFRSWKANTASAYRYDRKVKCSVLCLKQNERRSDFIKSCTLMSLKRCSSSRGVKR